MLTQTLQPFCDVAATDFVANDSRPMKPMKSKYANIWKRIRLADQSATDRRPIAVDVRSVSDLMK